MRVSLSLQWFVLCIIFHYCPKSFLSQWSSSIQNCKASPWHTKNQAAYCFCHECKSYEPIKHDRTCWSFQCCHALAAANLIAMAAMALHFLSVSRVRTNCYSEVSRLQRASRDVATSGLYSSKALLISGLSNAPMSSLRDVFQNEPGRKNTTHHHHHTVWL